MRHKVRVQFRCSEGRSSEETFKPLFIRALKSRGLDSGDFQVSSGSNFVPESMGGGGKSPEQVVKEAQDYDYVVHVFKYDADVHHKSLRGKGKPVVMHLGDAATVTKDETLSFAPLLDHIIKHHSK